MEVGMGRAACQGLALSCPYNVRGDTLPRWGCVILANTLHFRPCNTGTERKVNPGACGVEGGGPCGTWRTGRISNKYTVQSAFTSAVEHVVSDASIPRTHKHNPNASTPMGGYRAGLFVFIH